MFYNGQNVCQMTQLQLCSYQMRNICLTTGTGNRVLVGWRFCDKFLFLPLIAKGKLSPFYWRQRICLSHDMGSQLHHGWEFSSNIRGKVDELVEMVGKQGRDSEISRQWSYVRNFSFESQICSSESDEILSQESCSCDIEKFVTSTVESIESGSELCESLFDKCSTTSLCDIFSQVRSKLSEPGFLNFCKILGYWKDEKLVNISFDSVILIELQENEEAPMSKVNSLTDLARKKPRKLCDCIIKLIRNESMSFTDEHLLEKICDVVNEKERMDLVMALTKKENFKEKDWNLLKVLSIKATPNSIKEIILFMNLKCEEFASSQTFARLLIHMCKNSQSHTYKDLLSSIIDKNKTLLKRQALKYLSND